MIALTSATVINTAKSKIDSDNIKTKTDDDGATAIIEELLNSITAILLYTLTTGF